MTHGLKTRFLVNHLMNANVFLKNDVFLKKWFTGFGTGLPIIPTGFQPLPTDQFIGFSTDLSVILIGKPIILILDFSNSKFKFKTVFYQFSR
jgi:hypothetical protein